MSRVGIILLLGVFAVYCGFVSSQRGCPRNFRCPTSSGFFFFQFFQGCVTNLQCPGFGTISDPRKVCCRDSVNQYRTCCTDIVSSSTSATATTAATTASQGSTEATSAATSAETTAETSAETSAEASTETSAGTSNDASTDNTT